MIKRIKDAILTASKKYENFYIYDENGILDRVSVLKNNFPQVDFLYSVKCNPHFNVLKTVFGQGFGADAASLQEVQISEKAGLGPEKIYYSAPGKTEEDINQAIEKSIIIADSINEILRIQKISENKGIIANIGLRINPDFSFYDQKGTPSKFGIDEEKALKFISETSFSNISITGIHVHLRSQELNAEVLSTYYKNMLALADKFKKALGKLDYVNMGSGIGIRYAVTDNPLDIEHLGCSVKQEIENFCNENPDTKVIIETGRFVVCDNGWYVTKVVDRKESYGKTFIILKNTLNGFIRPSLAKLIISYSAEENPKGTEPLFTSKNAFSFIALTEKPSVEKVILTGNLCTAADVIATDIMMPRLQEGDIIAVTNAGSYAAVLSPMQFSSQSRPVQLFLTKCGDIL